MLKIRDKIEEPASGGGISLPIDAVDVNYDNATSGLVATDVQDAIDEVVASIPTLSTILGGIYGDGSDGDLSISSGITSLTSAGFSVNYGDVTITGSATIQTAGRVVYADVLDVSAAPANALNVNGGNASGATVGQSLNVASRQTPAVGASNAGGASSTTAGARVAALTNASFVITSNVNSYSNNGSGGAGGSSGANAGGIVRLVGNSPTSSALVVAPVDPAHINAWLRSSATVINGAPTLTVSSTNSGATGGGGGAGSGTQVGTAGGGGGGTGGPLIVYAREIVVSGSTPAGVFSAIGGNGGSSANATNANTAAGGGGGGGQGGLVLVVCDKVTATDSTTSVADALIADGGAGGNAGNSNGTATAGNGGYGGRAGRVILWVRGTGLIYHTGGSSSSAPVGQTGSAGAQARLALPVG